MAIDAPDLIHELRSHLFEWLPRQPWFDALEGEIDDITVIRTGGHFAGSSVLHWAGGAGGQGVLMTGDTITVVPDTRWMSFMYSYPNLIPLPARKVREIAAKVAPYPFERVYSAWWDRVCDKDAKARLAASVERYIAALS